MLFVGSEPYIAVYDASVPWIMQYSWLAISQRPISRTCTGGPAERTMSTSLCLSPAARRSVFATTRILSWKKTALRRVGTEQEWNPEDSWRSCKGVSHGISTLRRLHTSSSLSKNVFLKLHCPQTIQSVDEKALQNLLAAISNVWMLNCDTLVPHSQLPVLNCSALRVVGTNNHADTKLCNY